MAHKMKVQQTIFIHTLNLKFMLENECNMRLIFESTCTYKNKLNSPVKKLRYVIKSDSHTHSRYSNLFTLQHTNMAFHDLRLPQSQYERCTWEKHAKAAFQSFKTIAYTPTVHSLSEAILVIATTLIYNQKPFLF